MLYFMGAEAGCLPCMLSLARMSETAPTGVERNLADALADVFDALTSERPYKEAWSIERSVGFIKENSGKHFDPELVELFVKLLPEVLAIKETFEDVEVG